MLLSFLFVPESLDYTTDRCIIDSTNAIAFKIIIYLALRHGSPIENKVMDIQLFMSEQNGVTVKIGASVFCMQHMTHEMEELGT